MARERQIAVSREEFAMENEQRNNPPPPPPKPKKKRTQRVQEEEVTVADVRRWFDTHALDRARNGLGDIVEPITFAEWFREHKEDMPGVESRGRHLLAPDPVMLIIDWFSDQREDQYLLIPTLVPDINFQPAANFMHALFNSDTFQWNVGLPNSARIGAHGFRERRWLSLEQHGPGHPVMFVEDGIESGMDFVYSLNMSRSARLRSGRG
jgi:hypothetical protein